MTREQIDSILDKMQSADNSDIERAIKQAYVMGVEDAREVFLNSPCLEDISYGFSQLLIIKP